MMTYGEGLYGDKRVYGDGITLANLPIKIISRTSKAVTVSWDKFPMAQGYLFYHNNQLVSRTFDPSRTSTRFAAVPGDVIAVRAVSFNSLAEGSVTV